MRVFASTVMSIFALSFSGCSSKDENLRTTTTPQPTFVPHSCSTPYGAYCSLNSHFAFRLDSVDITIDNKATIVGVKYTLDGPTIIINTHDARLKGVGNVALTYDRSSDAVKGVYDGKDVANTLCGSAPSALPATPAPTHDPSVVTTTPKPKTIPPPEGVFCTIIMDTELTVAFAPKSTPSMVSLTLVGGFFGHETINIDNLEFEMDGVQVMYDPTHPKIVELFDDYGFTKEDVLIFYDVAADEVAARISGVSGSAGRCVDPPQGSYCALEMAHEFDLSFNSKAEPYTANIKVEGVLLTVDIKDLTFKMDGRKLIYDAKHPDVVQALDDYGVDASGLVITHEEEKGLVCASVSGYHTCAPKCEEGAKPASGGIGYGPIMRWPVQVE